MATAKIKVTERDVVVKQAVNEFHLVLTEEEAVALYAITGKIAGMPLTSSRKHSDSIREALVKADTNIEKLYAKKFGRYGEVKTTRGLPVVDGQIKFYDES